MIIRLALSTFGCLNPCFFWFGTPRTTVSWRTTLLLTGTASTFERHYNDRNCKKWIFGVSLLIFDAQIDEPLFFTVTNSVAHRTSDDSIGRPETPRTVSPSAANGMSDGDHPVVSEGRARFSSVGNMEIYRLPCTGAVL